MKIKNDILIVVVLCFLSLAAGCRREEEDDAAVAVVEDAAEVPESFTVIPGTDPEIFISEEPVSIYQYIEYLDVMGFEAHDSPALAGTDKKAPLTGLTRSEAEAFARWNLSRLPSEEEWEMAGEIVEQRQYPWDNSDPRPDIPIHLVREWSEGSESEEAAMQGKSDLIQERLEYLTRKIPSLQEDIKEYISDAIAETEGRWLSLKTELFSAIDSQKEVSETKALLDLGQKLDGDILVHIQERKLPIRIRKQEEEVDQEHLEELISSYKEYLEGLRTGAQDHHEMIVGKNRELSEEIRPLKQQIEQYGEKKLKGLGEIKAELEDAVFEMGEIDEAVQFKNRLLELKDRAQTASDEIMSRMAELEEEIFALINRDAEPDNGERLEEVRSDIEAREQTIKKWSEAIGLHFELEPHLFKDLRDLKRIRARREGLEHELMLLESIVEEIN